MKKSEKTISWDLNVTNKLHAASFPWMPIVTLLLKKFLPFREPNVSLPCPQNPTTQPSESRPHPTSLWSILTLIPIYVKVSQLVPQLLFSWINLVCIFHFVYTCCMSYSSHLQFDHLSITQSTSGTQICIMSCPNFPATFLFPRSEHTPLNIVRKHIQLILELFTI